METILIATDFSAAARNAMLYGFELARLLPAKVILFTAYQPSLTLPDSALYIAPEELEKDSYELLRNEIKLVDPGHTVSVETRSQQGPVGSSILDTALQNNASYTVLGMKEHGREIRKYFGSTVTHLCKFSTVPLFVVPANTVFLDPDKIALASDINDDTDVHLLDPLKRIAERFHSRLYIVRVIKGLMDQVEKRRLVDERLSIYLANVEHHFEFMEGANVAKALNEFVQKQAVNMVAVMPQKHSFLEGLFTRSVTKDLVFKSNVPLLIFPDRNHENRDVNDGQHYNEKQLYNIN